MLEPFLHPTELEAGLDEAGRGCYAGPVFAAAVVLPKNFHHPMLNDSKKLSEKQRDSLRHVIENESLYYCVASIDSEEIDRINILQASFKAMHGAIDNLGIIPESLLIDGNRFKPYPGIRHTCIIKGDGKYSSIAAASILAKTYRDAYMQQIHQEFPLYCWNKNKGYGTSDHRKAIELYGLSPYHRKSFRIVPGDGPLFK